MALTSPADYYKEGEGSLMQCVLTPGDKWMPKTVEEIAEATLAQVLDLFPSARSVCRVPCLGRDRRRRRVNRSL